MMWIHSADLFEKLDESIFLDASQMRRSHFGASIHRGRENKHLANISVAGKINAESDAHITITGPIHRRSFHFKNSRGQHLGCGFIWQIHTGIYVFASTQQQLWECI